MNFMVYKVLSEVEKTVKSNKYNTNQLLTNKIETNTFSKNNNDFLMR